MARGGGGDDGADEDEHGGGHGPEAEAEQWHEIAMEYDIDRRFCNEVAYELAAAPSVVAALVPVRMCLAKNRKEQLIFVDAANRCLLDCLAALARSGLAAELVAEAADRLLVLFHVLSLMMNCHFRPQVAAHLQRFIDELSRPLTGMLGLLARAEELAGRQQGKTLAGVEGKVRRLPHTLLGCLHRVSEQAIDGDGTVGGQLAAMLSWSLEHLARFLEAPEEVVLVDVARLPAAGGAALRVRLRAHRTTAQQLLSLPSETTAGDLRRCLACEPSAAAAARLLVRRKPPGVIRAFWDCRWTELPDSEPLQAWVCSIPGCESLGVDLHIEVELPPEASEGGSEAGSGARHPTPWLPGWPFPLWPGKFPLLKVGLDAATRMLVELRAAYEEPDFQREYKGLRRAGGMRAHVEKALSVQCDIIKRFGFPGDVLGVEEMRKQASYWANTELSVKKLLADIHSCLEYGRPRVKVLVPTRLPPAARAGRVALGAWWPTEPSEQVAEDLRASVDEACAEAARKIAEADILLLCTGAGFSADSGLAVYADVAKVQAYADRGLEYHDLCTPQWLSKEPELFWGFWGQCHNDYRETSPHEGYRIVSRWADRKFRRSNVAEAIRFRLGEATWSAQQDEEEHEGAVASSAPPYAVRDHAGAFFAFTSNVDAHHFDWFRACEIRECHGSVELYQCSSRDGPCRSVWRAPAGFHFSVDKSTMLAPVGSRPADDAASAADPADGGQEAGAAPRVGHVRGGGRPNALRHMPPPSQAGLERGFASNHPRCLCCGGPARPAVQMFGDTAWRDVPSQASRWDSWVSTVRELTAEGVVKAVVILEIGAGGRVTTVRKTSEQHLQTFRNAGAEAHLVRVNPDLPLGDSELMKPSGKLSHSVTSIMARGLDSLLKIDAALPDAMR